MRRSPFKFLDSYQKEDRDRFFGRERETAQLYNAVRASNLVLVYGGSGTGKTSIINCGLANQFVDSDWLPLFVRRGTDLNESLSRALTTARQRDGERGATSITDRIRDLYLDHYRALYLIFDQFEELFILGSRAEQQAFYATVREVLAANAPCKMIIVLREEYIAGLSAFEKVVPTLFDNRLRVEKMNDANLARIVMGTARAVGIGVSDPPATVSHILDNIRDRRTGIDLANLQVYLDRLWRADVERQGTDTPTTVTFDVPLTERVGRLENVISAFLDEELGAIEQGLAKRGVAQPQGIPLEILFALVTEEGTKRNLDIGAILDAVPANRAISEATVRYCLTEFERIRVVRPLAPA
jgi:KaiC/GvpD/RAD55 family RecA-like ATPase